MSALPGQAGCLLRNTKCSQEYLAQDGTDRPCHLHWLPADLLTPQIYLRHLKAAASERDLPVSPPATDTHPLPVRAQLSLDPLSISWASQLRFHQRVSTPQNVLSVPRFQGGGRDLMERGWVWTLRGAHTELWPPRCFLQNPSLVHRSPGLLFSFPGEAARSLPSGGTRSYVGPRTLPALPMPQSHFLKHSFR